MPIGLGLGAALGGLGGSLLGGLFDKDVAPFHVPDKELRSKIDRADQFSQSEVTGPSKAGEISLAELDRQKSLNLNQSAAQGQAQQASSIAQQQMFGGAGGGSIERASRNTANQQGTTDQQLRSSFAGNRAGLLSQDLGNEQLRRDRAGEVALNAESNLFGSRVNAELARVGQGNAANANQRGVFSGLGGLIGGIAGYDPNKKTT